MRSIAPLASSYSAVQSENAGPVVAFSLRLASPAEQFASG
jgi:hypothetical protein